eukprot:2988146-Pyramimonas_sp.AAC.1
MATTGVDMATTGVDLATTAGVEEHGYNHLVTREFNPPVNSLQQTSYARVVEEVRIRWGDSIGGENMQYGGLTI